MHSQTRDAYYRGLTTFNTYVQLKLQSKLQPKFERRLNRLVRARLVHRVRLPVERRVVIDPQRPRIVVGPAVVVQVVALAHHAAVRPARHARVEPPRRDVAAKRASRYPHVAPVVDDGAAPPGVRSRP